MLFRRWLAMALGVIWLTLWTHLLGVEASKKGSSHHYTPDYFDESSEWDRKLQQFKYLVDKSGHRQTCGLDAALIAILLFLPLIGFLGLVAPLMLSVFPLLLGMPTLAGSGSNAGVTIAGYQQRSIDDVRQRVLNAINRITS